jgi:methionyl-tRNA formyltransferase
MVDTLRGLQSGSLRPHPQDDSHATLAPILRKEDGLIDFNRPAAEILNRLRGFQPWPGAFTEFRGKNFQVWRVTLANQSLAPAELHLHENHVLVGCANGTSLELLEIQLEGKKRMTALDFVHGYKPQPGEKLGA